MTKKKGKPITDCGGVKAFEPLPKSAGKQKTKANKKPSGSKKK